ncbi:penicillin-binding protein [Corynebacterium sp. sy017]|uniref:transglycosylase domain-containing protein n=1 Tax=unclassified Corynebacterium TaxID=2624378 RepID=UPI001184D702|nr:transglycosylase domain-containing protein [Corynebacterium sp. SY003]MBP3089406.1 penicillin-binding protein [Corynebacterium sp. sy017]TSD91104.1 penicillin-binding protein [Corynebacterium sp. SY003]
MSKWKSIGEMLAATVGAGIVCALAISPVAAIGSVAVKETNETMQSKFEDLSTGSTPGVTTVTDKNGDPIAWLYDQRRFEVPSDAISQSMKDAIVSIEDRRFYEHKGVDIQGNLRAIAANVVAGGVEQGASTIDQQYVKNYLLLVASHNEDEQAAAIETSIPRKLREMRMASDLDKQLPKDEILTRYLNLIPFGNGAYGIEAAAQTYFGIPAAQLNIPQSAMLAGMVQSSSYLNPYTNPDAVTQRRNAVLDAMANAGVISPEDATTFSAEPLAVLETPQGLPNGCIAAGNSGFFCDYVLDYLSQKGFDINQIHKGAYTIKTTLDPVVQQSAQDAVSTQVSPDAVGVADVMNVIEPGKESRRVLAMTSSRNYGLDPEAAQTVFPQASTLVGNGAGSIFKIFTAAAALEQGYGLDTIFAVPNRYETQGMGEGGAENCPAGSYCVENSGSYASQMSLRDALAYSPNTTFVKLIEQVGVADVVDISVRLGLRSYTNPGTFDGESSIADYVKDHNLGSYTLGPTAVNPLELSNVAASLASEGTWCEPNPIESITDAQGQEVSLPTPPCEQALDRDVANALAAGMSQDATKGTAQRAARAAGWKGQLAAKTGTTESHESAAFLGFNSNFAAASYIYNDGTTIVPLCTSPVYQCGTGSLYGGDEPARTWFSAAGQLNAAAGTLPGYDAKYNQGFVSSLSASYRGRDVEEVRKELTARGYDVLTQVTSGDGTEKNHVMRVDAPVPLKRGARVTVYVSDGTIPVRPTRNYNPPTTSNSYTSPDINIPTIETPNLDGIVDQLQDLLNQR